MSKTSATGPFKRFANACAAGGNAFLRAYRAPRDEIARRVSARVIDHVDAALAVFDSSQRCVRVNAVFGRVFPKTAAILEQRTNVDYFVFETLLENEGLKRESGERFSLNEVNFYRRAVSAIGGGGKVVSFTDLTDLETTKRMVERLAEMASETFRIIRAGVIYWDENLEVTNVISVPDDGFPLDKVRLKNGSSLTDYLEFIRQVPGGEDRTVSTVKNGKVWSDDMPIEERLGAWDRALAGGVFRHTRMHRARNGGYVTISIDTTERQVASKRAEIQSRFAAAAFQVLPAAYEYWNDQGLLVEWDTEGKGALAGFADLLEIDMTFEDYLTRLSKMPAEIPRQKPNGQWNLWGAPIPLEERSGVWDRELVDGTFLRTTVAPTRHGGTLVVTIDLSKMRAYQKQVEEREGQLRTIVRNLGAFWTVWDNEQRLVLCGENSDLSPIWGEIGDRFPPGMPYPEFLRAIGGLDGVEDLEKTQLRDDRPFEKIPNLQDKLGVWNRVMKDGRHLKTTVSTLPNGGYAVASLDVTAAYQTGIEIERARETIDEIVSSVGIEYQVWTIDQKLSGWRGVDPLNEPLHIEGMSYADWVVATCGEVSMENVGKSTLKAGRPFSQIRDISQAVGTWDRHMLDGVYIRTTVAQLKDDSYAVVSQNLTALDIARRIATDNERLARVGATVAGMSHEVSTPMGIAATGSTFLLKACTELLERYEDGTLSENTLRSQLKRAKESAELVVRNLGRATGLMNNFKQFAADVTSESRRQIDVVLYVKEVIRDLTPSWKLTRHRFLIEGSEEVHADIYPGIISRIVMNLANNALMHAFVPPIESGTAVLTISEDENNVVFEYRDDGVGIADKDKDQIFVPFFTTKSGRGGTGLGLSIIKTLVTESLAGTIETLPLNRGFGLRITFPKVSPKMSGAHV